jgi:ribonuclease HI
VLIAGAFGRIAGSALDVELFIPLIKQQIKKLNGDALIQLLGSPIEEPIYEARTKGKRYAKHLSPL